MTASTIKITAPARNRNFLFLFPAFGGTDLCSAISTKLPWLILFVAPNLTLEIVGWHDRVYEDVEAGKIDIALSGIAPSGSLEREMIFEEQCVCVLGSKRKHRRARFTLKEYLALSHVSVNVLAGQQPLVDRPLAELALKRRIALIVPFFVPAILAIAHTDLVITVPRCLAQNIRGMTNLPIIKPPAEIRSFQYFMIWHPRTSIDPLQAWFREQLGVSARYCYPGSPICSA
jgi:DNA-binding transcriptional LysR family regulator